MIGSGHYVQISSPYNQTYVGVSVQGRPGIFYLSYSIACVYLDLLLDVLQYVTSYSVQYTIDGVVWNSVDSSRTFTGSSDQNTIFYR